MNKQQETLLSSQVQQPTNAIIDCLQAALEGEETILLNNTISSILWQMQGNLTELEKITDVWARAEGRSSS